MGTIPLSIPSVVSLLQNYLLLCWGNSSFQQPLGKSLQEGSQKPMTCSKFFPKGTPSAPKMAVKSVPTEPWLPQGGQAQAGFIAHHSQLEGSDPFWVVFPGLKSKKTKAEQALQGLLLQTGIGSAHLRKWWSIISFYDLVKVKFQSSRFKNLEYLTYVHHTGSKKNRTAWFAQVLKHKLPPHFEA